jgi:PST family polysaccharide transporter
VLWLGLGRDWRTIGGASIDARVWRETLIGTAKVVAARSTGYLNCRADNLLVASVLGPTAMSFYGMAWTASRQAIGLLDAALDSVLTPALAQIREDRNRVGGALREAVRHYYLLLVPVSAGLFVAAPELVTLVLGSKWLPMVPCLRVMSVTILASPLMTGCSSLLTASGRAHLFGMAATAQLLTLVIVVPFLSMRWGIVGAAWGDFAAVMVLAIALRMASARAMPGMRWDVWRAGGAPGLGGAVAGAIGWSLGAQVSDVALRLVCEVVVIGLSYVAVLWCFGGRDKLNGLVAAFREAVRRAEPIRAATSSTT